MHYPKPRKMMSVERMRKQRMRHFDLRYRVEYIPDNELLMADEGALNNFLETLVEIFRHEVLLWNMWRKAKLSPITVSVYYDISFNCYKLIAQTQRLREPPIKEFG